MRILEVIFAFALFKCFTTCELQKQHRIVGGHDVNIIDYPYQVSIERIYSGHYCGGTIHKANIIVTAAHCVYNQEPSKLFVRAGSSFKERGGVVIEVKKIIVHELFSEPTPLDNDIAILILQENLPLLPEIQPIELATEEAIINQIANISGWGTYKIVPVKLHAVEVPIYDWDGVECNEAWLPFNEVTENMICAGLKCSGKDTCNGDSGGPLVINNKLFGVTSWGRGCANPNAPGVYTKIKNFVNWINNATKYII